MEKTREIMPVKTVTSPRSAPQGTFRQATRGVSKENEFEANFLVHAYLHFPTPYALLSKRTCVWKSGWSDFLARYKLLQ